MSRSNCCMTPISHKSSDAHTPTLPFVAVTQSGGKPTALAYPTATSKSSPVSAWKLTSLETTSSGLIRTVTYNVLGCSFHCCCTATSPAPIPFPNGKHKSWIFGIVHALEYFGGTPQVLVMDNAKALVKHSSWYEGEVQQTECSLCNHYDIEPRACQPRRPKHKNRVEAGVGLAQRRIIAAMEAGAHPDGARS